MPVDNFPEVWYTISTVKEELKMKTEYKEPKICSIKTEYYEESKTPCAPYKKKYVKKNKIVNIEFKEWSL